jgi:aminobenzoyl-glutamate transport protein
VSDSVTDDTVSRRQRGFLGFVERLGNLLPEPTMIFVYLILVLMALSALGDVLGWSASLPFSGEEAPTGATLTGGVLTYEATSLFWRRTCACCSRRCRAR